MSARSRAKRTAFSLLLTPSFLSEGAAPAGTCVADDETRRLRDSRFEVEIEGGPAITEAASRRWCARAQDSGLFYFFSIRPRVSAETARRIACDAGKVRMTHRNGEILSVGRKTRTIPPPVRRALEFRDGGCRFPGCTSRYCDAHHIHHWADGGETKLSNLVLLCRWHHRLLHESGFAVRMGADGAAQFFHPRGRPLHESPAPPPVGPYPCDDLLRDLEDAGILVTGNESMPSWDGTPMDLRYVMECLWKPPPHLQAVVDRERYGATVRKQTDQRAA